MADLGTVTDAALKGAADLLAEREVRFVRLEGAGDRWMFFQGGYWRVYERDELVLLLIVITGELGGR